LQYLKQIDPSLSRVALLINPTAKISEFYVVQSKEAAPGLGLAVQEFDVRSVGSLVV
jgi:putative ABC transport system substrate-binding protein